MTNVLLPVAVVNRELLCNFAGVLGEPLPVTAEADVFDYVGMDYKTPEERNI
jgi:hypothetical protein